MIKTVNPATGEFLAEFSPRTAGDVEQALTRAERAKREWRRTPFASRGEKLRALAKILHAQKDRLAQVITREMGKPIREAQSEVEKCALACEYYAENASQWLQDEVLVDQNPRCFVTYQPLGVVFGVMPWNFPFWQVIRFAAPTVMAGNVVIVKHAPNTWGSAAQLAQCFREAGFPEGVYQDLPVDLDLVEMIISDSRIAGVSLTGSTRAGRSVGELAGRYLKKCVLELGGSDPYVILDDADVRFAAEKCVQARMLNGGQSCIAGKRFIVTKKNAGEFTNLVRDLLRTYEPADPLDPQTKLGPLARKDLRELLHNQVVRAKRQGAKSLMGGELPDGEGFFYPATLLTEIGEDSPVFKEEFFGPVAAVIAAENESEALRLANQSNYGLGAAVFSRDTERAQNLARVELEAGVVVVNGVVRSDPRWPFGGIKESGLGRELAEFGTREFVNVKSVVVD